jgi:hypothetical protein
MAKKCRTAPHLPDPKDPSAAVVDHQGIFATVRTHNDVGQVLPDPPWGSSGDWKEYISPPPWPLGREVFREGRPVVLAIRYALGSLREPGDHPDVPHVARQLLAVAESLATTLWQEPEGLPPERIAQCIHDAVQIGALHAELVALRADRATRLGRRNEEQIIQAEAEHRAVIAAAADAIQEQGLVKGIQSTTKEGKRLHRAERVAQPLRKGLTCPFCGIRFDQRRAASWHCGSAKCTNRARRNPQLKPHR